MAEWLTVAQAIAIYVRDVDYAESQPRAGAAVAPDLAGEAA